MKDKVLKLWNDEYLPVLEIAHRLNISKKKVMQCLGDKYTKNEGHYRATKFRDQQRLKNLEKWYRNEFRENELRNYAEKGCLNDYYLKIYHETKVSVSKIRKFLTQKGIVIPKAKKNTYSSKYHIGKKSKYYQREDELISMWKEQGMSIQKINQETGVGKRTLKKLLDPLGYDASKMKKESINKALSIVHQQQTDHINEQIRKLNLSQKEIETMFANRTISAYALDKSKEINVKPANIIRELRKELPNNFKNPYYLPNVNELSNADFIYLKNNQKELHRYIQRLANKQKVKKSKISQAIYYRNKDIFSNQWQKRIRNSMISQNDIDEIINLYVNEYWTINELVKKYDLSTRKIKKILKDKNVLDCNKIKRTKRTYDLRKNKIRKSNTNNLKLYDSNRRKIHKISKIPQNYLDQVPEEIWDLIEKQPDLLLLDKLMDLTNTKENVLELLKIVEKLAHHKVSLSGLNEYLPTFEGLGDWNKRISEKFAKDPDIQIASGSLSKYEEKVNKLLISLNVSFELHNRTLAPGYEFDFYLPKQHLAIETSPLETHNSNQYKHFGQVTVDPKPSTYHQKKYNAAQERGITLITLFSKHLSEPEWSTIIKPLLKFLITKKVPNVFYARQTHIDEINKAQADEFLNKNHVDGATQARHRYGIFDSQNQLLGVATFSLPQNKKYKQEGLIELKRLAWRADVQVRYGLSKLIAFAQKEFSIQYSGILSYSDNNIGNGRSYAKAGFELIDETVPQLHYVNPIHPQDEYSWSIATTWGAKSGVLAQKFGSQDISNQEARKLVETELPHRLDKGKGYVAQYDCGNKCWKYKFK